MALYSIVEYMILHGPLMSGFYGIGWGFMVYWLDELRSVARARLGSAFGVAVPAGAQIERRLSRWSKAYLEKYVK